MVVAPLAPERVGALGHQAVRETLEQIDVIHRMVAGYPDGFEMALTADDIVRIRKKGKIASPIGVEGGHSIRNSLRSELGVACNHFFGSRSHGEVKEEKPGYAAGAEGIMVEGKAS